MASSPSEVLMGVMEEFGQSEGTNVLVVYSNQDGDVCIRGTYGYIEMVGIGEWVRSHALKLLNEQ